MQPLLMESTGTVSPAISGRHRPTARIPEGMCVFSFLRPFKGFLSFVKRAF